MALVINIRGPNGSGKSTLARGFLPPNLRGDGEGGPVDLVWYSSPTKKDQDRELRTEGYCRLDTWGVTGVVGPYRTACGGMDAMPGFQVCQRSIAYMLDDLALSVVVAEGVLASTVYGSWAEFDKTLEARGHIFAWCYLHVGLDECLRRIRHRQAEAGRVREIKEELVADKVRAVQSTRAKALWDGRVVYDLPADREAEALQAIAAGRGEGYRAR